MPSQRSWQRVLWSVVLRGLVSLGAGALWYWLCRRPVLVTNSLRVRRFRKQVAKACLGE